MQDLLGRLCKRKRLEASVRLLFHRTVVMPRKDAIPFVEEEGLSEIGRWEELEVESSCAGQRSGERLIEMHRHAEAAWFGLNFDAISQALIWIEAECRQLIFGGPALPLLEFGNRIPLRRHGRQAHVAVGGDASLVQNDFEATHFLVPEDLVISVVEQEHGQTVRLQSFFRAHLKSAASSIK